MNTIKPMFKYVLKYQHSYNTSSGEITVYAESFDEAKDIAEKAVPSPKRGHYDDKWEFSILLVSQVSIYEKDYSFINAKGTSKDDEISSSS